MSIQDWPIWEHLPYLSVAGVLIAAGCGVPFPEDIPLLTGGYLCYRGLADLWVMIAVAMVGVLVGDSAMFFLGWRFGHHVTEHRFFRRYVKPHRLVMAEALFQKHGIKILFAARFLPGLRSMIFLAAGVLRVPYYLYIAVNGFAAMISVPVFVFLGYYFGADFDALLANVRSATHTVLAVAVVVILGIGLFLWHRHKRRLVLLARAGEEDAGSPVEMSEDASRELRESARKVS